MGDGSGTTGLCGDEDWAHERHVWYDAEAKDAVARMRLIQSMMFPPYDREITGKQIADLQTEYRTQADRAGRLRAGYYADIVAGQMSQASPVEGIVRLAVEQRDVLGQE